MSEQQEKALDALAELSQEMETQRILHESAVDVWWNNLHEDEREWAFYAVCKRIHKAELQDRGTYRWALYDVFGFDGGMYRRGMDCGFMDLHNSIIDEDQKAVLRKYNRMEKVNRLEVIDESGRAYVKYLDKDQKVRYSLQDEDKTLKVFIDDVTRLNDD